MRVLVLQHIAVEHPGVFGEFMASRADHCDVVELDEAQQLPETTCHDLLLAMGGPMDVWQKEKFAWLVPEIRFIRSWIDAGKPFLGVCLGHQLLAEAIGGVVGPMARPEVGIKRIVISEAGRADPLFRGVAPALDCLQWHGSEVKALPPGAVVLAGNDECAIQAFRYGQRAYGIQCHVEVTPDTLRYWSAVPEYAASLEAALGQGAQTHLEMGLAAKVSTLRAAALQLFENLARMTAGSACAEEAARNERRSAQ